MVIMMYDGARSFPTHAEALAYALLPVDPDLTRNYPPRREVFRTPDTGRWIARGTSRLAPPRPHRCSDLCGLNGRIVYPSLGPAGSVDHWHEGPRCPECPA